MPDRSPTGVVAGRYELESPLGQGGMGTVYRARDKVLGRTVALKVLRGVPESAATQTPFQREARALATLRHPNILALYDAGSEDGLLYLATEFVEGESLRDLLRRVGPLPAPVATKIAIGVGRALEHAHEHRVVHADIKPGNILLTPDGRVLVSDFGLARQPGSEQLDGGRIVGTPRYMSPEQAMGGATDSRADIFSLGVVLYEMLAGDVPFTGGSSAELIRNVVERTPRSLAALNPNLPQALCEVVDKAIAKSVERRFSSARELVAALEATGLARDRVDLPVFLPPEGDESAVDEDVDDEAPESELPVVVAAADEDPTVSTLPYVRSFETLWSDLLDAAQRHDKERFIRLSDTIIQGVLRETIGYRVEYSIPYFRGTVGHMVDAPMLWIRHSRFPILFVAFNPAQVSVLPTIIKQLEIARATEFFAVLVVVPTGAKGDGNEAQELRRQVSDSVFQHDFVVLDGRHLASIIQDGSTQPLVEIILRQGIGLYSVSPYVVNGPVPERMFFGREQEVKIVSQNLADRNYVVLGGRRIGKSSILLRLNRLLNSDPRFRAVYVNCEDKADHEEFLDALTSDFGLTLDSTDARSFRQVVAHLAEAPAARRVVFLLDEIDELLSHEAEAPQGPRLFRVFRSLSHEGACRFVFSGSRTVHRYLRDPQSPFFNFCEALVLRPLDAKSIAEIVTKPMRQLGIDLIDEEHFIQRLIELTSSHPNLAQWVCDRLVKTALESLGAGVPALLDQLAEALRSNRRTTVGDLEILAETREFHEYYVATAWGDAPPLARLISLVAPEPGFSRETIQQALEQYGVSDLRSIVDALDTLDLYSLIERRDEKYRFRMRLFPQLVRQIDGMNWQLDAALQALRKQ